MSDARDVCDNIFDVCDDFYDACALLNTVLRVTAQSLSRTEGDSVKSSSAQRQCRFEGDGRINSILGVVAQNTTLNKGNPTLR